MAKALLGHMSSDLHHPARQAAARLAAENGRLRERITDLEALVLRLKEENEQLAPDEASTLLDPIDEMQPA